MRKRAGQSLTEYGVIAGLIAAVAIPALILMGQNVNYKLSETKTALPVNPMSIIDPANARPAVTGNPGGGQASGILSGSGGWRAKYDPASGQILYALPASGGGGTNTVSVEGNKAAIEMTEAVANMLVAMEQSAAASGTPLPESVRQRLGKMAGLARDMAVQEELYGADLVETFKDPSIIGMSNLDSDRLKALNLAFADEYNALSAEMQGQYGDLYREVGAYAGVITTVANENFLKHTLNKLGVVVGTKPLSVPKIEDSAAVTNENADNIDDTAQSGAAASG